jgi:dynein heavy chain
MWKIRFQKFAFQYATCKRYITGSYRDELVDRWVARCKELDIPVSDDCTLRGTLASPVEVGLCRLNQVDP